jgi:hypothetical protein
MSLLRRAVHQRHVSQGPTYYLTPAETKQALHTHCWIYNQAGEKHRLQTNTVLFCALAHAIWCERMHYYFQKETFRMSTKHSWPLLVISSTYFEFLIGKSSMNRFVDLNDCKVDENKNLVVMLGSHPGSNLGHRILLSPNEQARLKKTKVIEETNGYLGFAWLVHVQKLDQPISSVDGSKNRCENVFGYYVCEVLTKRLTLTQGLTIIDDIKPITTPTIDNDEDEKKNHFTKGDIFLANMDDKEKDKKKDKEKNKDNENDNYNDDDNDDNDDDDDIYYRMEEKGEETKKKLEFYQFRGQKQSCVFFLVFGKKDLPCVLGSFLSFSSSRIRMGIFQKNECVNYGELHLFQSLSVLNNEDKFCKRKPTDNFVPFYGGGAQSCWKFKQVSIDTILKNLLYSLMMNPNRTTLVIFFIFIFI